MLIRPPAYQIFYFFILLVFSSLVTALDTVDSTPGSNATPVVENVCPPNLTRPCVALVLGGGGARGSAHIGVLKALEEQGVPVDIIVGTSIGSFVGGLYASGKSADEIKTLFEEADWNSGYRDDLSRSEIPNRRKRQLDTIPIHLDLGLASTGIKLPKGFLQGQGMKALVDSMLGSYPQFASFNDLPIPFRAVAADAETGEEVILAGGDLATALQISMSLPGVVRPVERDGRILVDGGVANNLPVSVAKSLGADIVIAVDIGSPSMDKSELRSGVSILRQLTSFLTGKNVEYQKSLLTDRDVFLQPEIQDVGLLSFDKTLEAVEAGHKEAQEKLVESSSIQALLKNEPKDSLQGISKSHKSTRLDAISITNNTRLGDDYILHRMGLDVGETYTSAEVQQGIDRLYGQGTIARITTSIEEVEDTNLLDVSVEEKEWGPGYLDFKLTFEDDFISLSRYQIGGSYRLTNLSPYGAEWYTTAAFGTEKLITTELYWPIYTSGFFWDVEAQFERQLFEYLEEDDLASELISSQGSVIAGIGWNSIDVFDVGLGATYLNGRIELPKFLADTLSQKNLDYEQSGLVLEANFDSLDDASFPTEGWKLRATLSRTRDDLEGFKDYTTQIDAEFNGVISFGRHNFRNLIRAQSNINNDPLALLGSFSLGGFLNLSGSVKDSVIGTHVRFFSIVYTYELAANDFGAITLPLYAGISAETGNAWDSRKDIDYSDMIQAGSIFVGWDSPIGPAYVAYGQSDNDEKSLYLFLGIVF